MANVIAWPPFCLTGWALDEVYPQSRSVGLIGGKARTSSAQRGRRMATAIISGIGADLAGAGYVRMLNRQWQGRDRLVRVECHSTLWYLSRYGQDLRNEILTWVDGATDMVWTVGATEMIWGTGLYATSGEPTTDGGWHSLTVSGLPPNTIVARPSERITITDGSTTQEGMVLAVARSNGSGVAIIRTDRDTAFTIFGLVSIGDAESIVFEALDVPRAVQQARGGDFFYQWDFREVFADEYPGGFTEVNPWPSAG